MTCTVQSPVPSAAKIGLMRNNRVGEFSHNSNCNDNNNDNNKSKDSNDNSYYIDNLIILIITMHDRTENACTVSTFPLSHTKP